MKNNLNLFFYNLGKFTRSLLKPFPIYLFFIIFIVFFPPMDWYHTPQRPEFIGLWFITDLGKDVKINMVYFLSEIGIVTLVYFMYLLSKKK